MRTVKPVVLRAVGLVLVAAFFAGLAGVALAGGAQMGGQGVDKRKLTTIQTATAGNVEVRYLNLPWGEKTFSYMEVGGDDYYSNRTWPFAHLKLGSQATFAGKTLAAGDYALVVTPKSAKAPMSLSVLSFKPGASGTFLVAGDVFTETPKDGVEVVKIPVSFTKGEPVVDHLEITLADGTGGAEMKVHYGDRWLTQTIAAK